MSRRFKAGDTFEYDGMRYRVATGNKKVRTGSETGTLGRDLVLEWKTPGGWVRPTFASMALMADFLCENEDHLYPPPAKGGNYLLGYLWQARRHGFRVAIARLADEKSERQARDAA